MSDTPKNEDKLTWGFLDEEFVNFFLAK